jgi:hypothetical protein
MTAPLPVPSHRPRLVDAAFWVWLVSAIMLVAFGLLLATSGGNIALLYRGFGILFALAGFALGFAAGKIRNGYRGFRRAAIGLSLGLVVLLALFSLSTRGLVWLLIMIAVIVGVVLVTRPAAQAWYEAEGR